MNQAIKSLALLCFLFDILSHVTSQPFHADQDNDDSDRAMTKRKAFDSLSGYTFGKRNFDEIDRAGFGALHKRNFDEIDRARFSAFAKRNFDELDRDRFSRFYKRNFDEIDRAGFGNRAFHKRNFDELDKSGFAAFNRYF